MASKQDARYSAVGGSSSEGLPPECIGALEHVHGPVSRLPLEEEQRCSWIRRRYWHCSRLQCVCVLILTSLILALLTILVLFYDVLGLFPGLFKQHCPNPSEFARCNWPDRFGNDDIVQDQALDISPENSLWVNPELESSKKARQEAKQAIQKIGSKPREGISEEFCSFLDSCLVKVGFNGIVDLIDEVKKSDEGGSSIWDLLSGQHALSRLDKMGDWKHFIGAYVIFRVEPARPMGASLQQDSAFFTNVHNAVEIAGSLKLGGAPLHAVIWTAMLSVARHSPELPPSGLWDLAKRLCQVFKKDRPGLFVHCLHGVGHGSLAVGGYKTMTELERKKYEDASICRKIDSGTTGSHPSSAALKASLELCRAGPSLQQQYICAGGVFMEFWKTADTDAEHGLHNLQQTCHDTTFAATCFRFEPEFFTQELQDRFKEFEDSEIYEPCTQSAWSWGLQPRSHQLRGCILGRSFRLYQHYDAWRFNRNRTANKLSTLREWCSMYEPLGLASPQSVDHAFRLKAPISSDVKTYGNWLACIAGSMSDVAFQLEAEGIDSIVVEHHCEQILDLGGQAICKEIGLSRKNLSAADLKIWPVSILENLNVTPGR